MTVIISRLTSSSRTTIPKTVRTALGLRDGDSLAFRIEYDAVILTRAAHGQKDDPFAHFEEWASDADRTAYGGL